VKKFLTGAYAFSLAGNIITSAAGFVGIWALARILHTEELGKWLLYISAFTFTDMLRSGIIHTSLIKHALPDNSQSVTGSCWVIGIGLSVLLVLLIWLLELSVFIFTGDYFEAALGLYLTMLIPVSLPFTFSLWLQQMNGHFNRIMYIRLILSVPFVGFLLSGFFFPLQLNTLIQVHLLSYLVASLIVIFCGWSNISSVFKASAAVIRKLLSFGKYTMGTLISTNLLKSTDTFMISWYLGPAALAAYSLPYKLIELVEIPLRSVAAALLPQAARHSNQYNLLAVKALFYRYTALLTMVLLPVSLLMFLFAKEMVVILGGEAYASSAGIFRCFVVYSLFLPLDRFLGITLDVLNKPQFNLLKVALMVLINIGGNLLAIHFFASPVFIAVATVVTVVSGCLLGWLLLKKIAAVKLSELYATACFAIRQRMDQYIKYKAA
jgi:O-antigen/teichoic acid export membrane protein